MCARTFDWATRGAPENRVPLLANARLVLYGVCHHEPGCARCTSKFKARVFSCQHLLAILGTLAWQGLLSIRAMMTVNRRLHRSLPTTSMHRRQDIFDLQAARSPLWPVQCMCTIWLWHGRHRCKPIRLPMLVMLQYPLALNVRRHIGECVKCCPT